MNIRSTLLAPSFALALTAVGSDTFVPTGNMPGPRFRPTATLLANGRVLAVGGDTVSDSHSSPAGTSALYLPDTGTWVSPGSMVNARSFHTATLLSNGKVLVAGGQQPSAFLDSSELFDPASGTWSTTGSLINPRSQHTATVVRDRNEPNDVYVLVVGGVNSGGVESFSEVYNLTNSAVVIGQWYSASHLTTARRRHSATLLSDGRVLVVGGLDGSGNTLTSAELLDYPGAWTSPGSMTTARAQHIATRLPNGKVLVTGGYDGSSYTASAELFDPSTGSWTATGSMAAARADHSAVLLRNGKVLVAGGTNFLGSLASAEIYDPATGTWSPVGGMAAPRRNFSATLLGNGRVLVAGGAQISTAVGSAELFIPRPPPTLRIRGPKRIRTQKPVVTISAIATGTVSSVTYRVGNKGAFKKAGGGGVRRTIKARLKMGNNTISVIAVGPGGSSPVARVVAVRLRPRR